MPAGTLTADERQMVELVSEFVDGMRPHSTPRFDALRVHGGYGYSKEYDVEPYFRDAPLMIVGEGTNEIQRNVIAAQLIARNPI